MTTSAGAAIESTVRDATDALVGLSHRIHANPELGWEEQRSSAWVGEALAGAGFDVEAGVGGLPTALRATAGAGSLHVALCAEYDALPGLGHACGHNLIAAMAVGAATGLVGVADDLGLTVTVLGTPAEEGGGGKIEMLDAGAFDGIHFALMAHPGPADAMEIHPLAVAHARIRYRGRTAHAAAFPEKGINAADAFTVAEVGVGLLRQHLPSHMRVHGIRTRSGDAPNIVPDLAEGRWYVRADSLEELAGIEDRIWDCFRAGALATGASLEIEPESQHYSEMVNDADLVALFTRNWKALKAAGRGPGEAEPAAVAAPMARASTDMGNVSLVVPSIHPYLGIDSGSAVNHQPEFAAHCATPSADAVLVEGAIALARTAADAAGDEVVRTRLLSP
jgi:amidohydrolase